MQLLWINLVTDSLPAIALGMEAVEKDVMDRKPKPKDEAPKKKPGLDLGNSHQHSVYPPWRLTEQIRCANGSK